MGKVFKLGKYYQHTTGEVLKMVGLAETYLWGRAMIGEKIGRMELLAVGSDEASAVNYKEISEEEALRPLQKEPREVRCKECRNRYTEKCNTCLHTKDYPNQKPTCFEPIQPKQEIEEIDGLTFWENLPIGDDKYIVTVERLKDKLNEAIKAINKMSKP